MQRTPFVTPPSSLGFQPVSPAQSSNLPFGIDFQGMLLKLLLSEPQFSRTVCEHVKPHFFQNEAHAWAWGMATHYRQSYGQFPTVNYVLDTAVHLGAQHGQVYAAALARVRDTPVTDELALRDRTLDFIRRNIFRQSILDGKDLYNAGKFDAAYDLTMGQMETIKNVSFEAADRGWLAEEFADRHIQRQPDSMVQKLIGTGIPELDKILEGGAYPKFLGILIAYAKAGKTTFLINLCAVAARAYRKRSIFFILEGSRELVEQRFDALLTGELYSKVKRGEVDAGKYAAAFAELQYLRRLVVLRAFTDDWETNVLHFWEELKELRRSYQWEPEAIFTDYVDLMKGRPGKRYSTPEEEASEACKDLKNLHNRTGAAGWTVSQVQRPKDAQLDVTPHILYSRQIAGCYARVRHADYIGSLNQTVQERAQKLLRLFSELYRDNEANHVALVNADFSHMKFGGPVVAASPNGATFDPNMLGVSQTKPLGYGVVLKQSSSGI